ncbi:MAG: SDR family NAD(P)-dependent oxidoreductase [Inquilinus sp.]|nr:SDR family NAD(P)-dependent oxidoreductase [Inquilinus sp.]
MEIHGQAAIVTGGGSGMGAATARALAAAGAKVAVLDLNAAAADAVATEIGGLACACDVADAAAVESAIAAARDGHGAARIAVNCAGIVAGGRVVGRDGPHDLALFRRTVEVNLIGSFNVLRLAAADMAGLEPLAEGERGVIVSTASIAAFEGQVGQAAYSASKGGIVGMTLPIARELARLGIRVMTVAPGLIATPMMTGLPAEVQESLVATTLFPKRLGLAEEFARLVLHIADNVFLNGETIRLDGAVRLAPR